MALFMVFLWKNFKYIRFHWLRTIVILAGCLLLLTVVMKATYSEHKQGKYIPETIYEDIYNAHLSSEPEDVIGYAPYDPWLDDMMESIRRDLSVVPSRWRSFSSKTEMSLYMQEKKNTKSFFIFFKEYPSHSLSSQWGNLSYSIGATHGRVSTSQLYYNDREVVGMQIYDDYVSNGYFALQRAIDQKYIERKTGKRSYPIETAPFPRIELSDIDSFRTIFFGLLFMLFFYIIMLTTFIVPLVEEKQDGMQAYLSFATSCSFLNRVTFYMIRLLIYVIFVISSISIGYFYNGLGNVCLFYIIALYMCFLLATMNYALLVSVFLKSVYFAKIGGFLAFFVPTILLSTENKILQRLAPLISGNIFLEGLKIFQIFTNKRRHFSSSDLFVSITSNSYTLLQVYMILIAQFFVYLILYNYLANIFPGIGGVCKPFCYIFKCGQKKRQNSVDSSETYLNSDIPIKIRNLVKTFGNSIKNPKVAVNNLNMDVENKKITVLLGHNGAGKTTTINMIIGAIDKTAGDIIVFGEKDVEMYRNSIGYCPQHNIFMQYLTCKEHLYFFSMLRGQTHREAENEAVALLSNLLLKEKSDEVGENLSGGMKRRLALGMAIAGNTQIAVLDEPTSGLDPESRRILWDILIKLRKTRTILITTHYMEEAEVLGDVISIMSQGVLVCNGSSMELKREYGSGYILKLLTTDLFKKDKTLTLIRSHVPNANIYSIIEPTVCISLPYSHRKYYSELLKDLEKYMEDYGISYISVANSSLEDVFLNCVTKDEADTTEPQEPRIPYSSLKSEAIQVFDLCVKFHQICGVLFKKYVYLKSKWLYTLIMFTFPILTIGITFWIMNADTAYSQSELQLNLTINIPDSEVYVKVAPEFYEFNAHLSNEIARWQSKPIYIAQHESLEEALLNVQEKDITHFYDRIFGAIELRIDENENPSVKILYSSNLIHSSVTLLNLVDNALLKFNAKHDMSILVENAPIPKSIIVSPARLEYFSSIVPIGCFFYMLFYVSLPFREKRTQFNKLQNISRPLYWASYTLFDVVLHLLLSVVVYAAIYIFNFSNVYNGEEIIKIATAFAFYGIGYLPLLYILANSFRSISTLSTYLFLFLIISTIIPIITSANEQTMQAYEIIISILMFLPDFAFKNQLIIINENYFITRSNAVKAAGSIKHNAKMTLNDGNFYYYMSVVFLISEIFLIVVWDHIYRRQNILQLFSFKRCVKKTKPDEEEYMTRNSLCTDVVDGPSNKVNSLNVNSLHKYYKCGVIHAVRGIDFSVSKGECFGLLGLNGAGKSSTFEMITGNETICKGSVTIKGVDINAEKTKFNSLYGYCPQVDALNGFMTSSQILIYIALLRGISLKNVHSEVTYWLKQLDLYKYRDVPIKHYSGGTKRKLNTAMAMIGDPTVVFLDEPTTGVDPKSRRFMWKCIQEFQRNNKTIVLTSHSMDECENLCNRLAIMERGKIKCVDYIPKLKEKYGDKFTITLRLKPGYTDFDLEKLRNKIDSLFECKEREHHDLTIVYSVEAKAWRLVFDTMEKLINQNEHILDDYAVSETTLEDIFLNMKS